VVLEAPSAQRLADLSAGLGEPEADAALVQGVVELLEQLHPREVHTRAHAHEEDDEAHGVAPRGEE
jgi:hypothetical protein